MKKYFVLAFLAVALVIPSGVFAHNQPTECRTGDVYNLRTGALCPWINTNVCQVGNIYNSLNGSKCSNPTSPEVSVLSIPTLKLSYDYARNESLLTANATISVAAGSEELHIVKNATRLSVTSPSHASDPFSTKYTVTPSINLAVKTFNNTECWVLPAGSKATFYFMKSMSPAELFAGTYTASVTSISAMDSKNTFVEIPVPSNQSSPVAVVGEKSPFITSVTSSVKAGDVLTILGQRMFNGSGLFIDGSATEPIGKMISNDGTKIYFTVPTWSVGSHYIEVSNGYGKSNKFGFTVIGAVTPQHSISVLSPNGGQFNNTDTLQVSFSATNVVGPIRVYLNSISGANVADAKQSYSGTGKGLVSLNLSTQKWSNDPIAAGQYRVMVCDDGVSSMKDDCGSSDYFSITSSAPTTFSVEAVGTPTLSLQYDSFRNESSLIAVATVKVTAGSSAVQIGSNNYLNFVSLNIGSRDNDFVSVSNDTTSYALLNSSQPLPLSVIPAGASATFKITRTMSPQQMFAGIYHAYVRTWINNNGSVVGGASNLVTIVGEKSPYISSITPSARMNETITILGQRLNFSNLYIDGVLSNPAGLSGSNDGLKVYFIVPASWQPGSHYVEISNTYGRSNKVYFTVTAVATTPSSAPLVLNAPAGSVPPPATNPIGSCVKNSNGTYTATFSWSAPAMTPPLVFNGIYNGIIDDLSNPFAPCAPNNTPNAGDICLNKSITSPVTFPGQAGHTYNAIVYSLNSAGGSNWVPVTAKITCGPVSMNSETSLTASVANSFDTQNSPDINSYSSALNNNLTCTLLSKNIQYRDNDVSSGGAVSKLQAFLKAKGYLSSGVTGNFGDTTFGAVKAFQVVNGLAETGYVGVMTRNKIKDLSCQSSF